MIGNYWKSRCCRPGRFGLVSRTYRVGAVLKLSARKKISEPGLERGLDFTTSLRAIDDLRDPWFGADLGFGEVGFREVVFEVFDRVSLDEVDGGAAEAAAGKTRAVTPFEFLGAVDESIEFAGAVLEVVARTGVTLEKILAELEDVALAQSAFAENDTLIFADDMKRAGVFALGEFGALGFELFGIDEAEELNAK